MSYLSKHFFNYYPYELKVKLYIEPGILSRTILYLFTILPTVYGIGTSINKQRIGCDRIPGSRYNLNLRKQLIWQMIFFIDSVSIIYKVIGRHKVYHNQMSREKTVFFFFEYAKTKTQISFVITAKLISAFVFATRIVQFLFYLNPKFQASSHFLWLYSPVYVGPCQQPRRSVFSQRGSNDAAYPRYQED